MLAPKLLGSSIYGNEELVFCQRHRRILQDEGASQKKVCKGLTFLVSECFGISGMLKTKTFKNIKLFFFFLTITLKQNKQLDWIQFENLKYIHLSFTTINIGFGIFICAVFFRCQVLC